VPTTSHKHHKPEEVKTTPTPDTKLASSAPVGEEEGPQWSLEQQKQLEDGMREFPATIAPKERWIKIGGVVTDKKPKECFERFKFIVAQLKNKKE
jgi:hypothetical protein